MSDDSISASKARATLLALLDEVAQSGRRVTVTKRGKPVADIVPHEHHDSYDLRTTARQLVSDEELLAPLETQTNVSVQRSVFKRPGRFE